MLLTDEQVQLILGSTLGNMSINRQLGGATLTSKRNPRVRVEHVESNMDYIQWKFSILGNLVTPMGIRCSEVRDNRCDWEDRRMCFFTTRCLSELYPLFNLCYSNGGKRRITPEWVRTLHHPISLAAYFMDSGGVGARGRYSQVRFTVPRCTVEEANIVKKYLFEEGMGIHTTLVSDINKIRGRLVAGGHHTLTIAKRSDVENFISIVMPYVMGVPSMRWKIEPFL